MRITTGHVVPSVQPARLTPAQVAREFRARIADGAVIKAVGAARDDPGVLLTRAYLPRYRLSLFDTTYYLSGVRQDPQIRFFVGYVVQPRGGRRPDAIHPRIFYKDVSLVWRSASHLVRTQHEHWIGKGELRSFLSQGHEYLVSAEETTNLPLEIQSALETLMLRSNRVVTDLRAVDLVLRCGGEQRLAPFSDFTGPRARARADRRNLINGGRRIARFTRHGDPASLVFTRGFEPNFAAGLLEVSRFTSRLYGGSVARCRISSHNAQVQYLFFAAPHHAWLGACQPTTTDITSYGVRSIDAWVDEELLMPGYEYHLPDEHGEVAEVTRQVPANFVGAPSTIDPNRVDTSAWLDRVPVIRAFRRALARAQTARAGARVDAGCRDVENGDRATLRSSYPCPRGHRTTVLAVNRPSIPESHTMSLNWRELPPDELERHFNPRVAVPDAQRLLDSFATRSADARKHIPGRYDLRYGPGPKATLDLHAPGRGGAARPLVMFIHGGYWRALDKSDHSFLAPPLLDAGAVLANVNYDLCPEVTLDSIVEAIADAVSFCHAEAAGWGADPDNMILFGHSAGAHLAAAMLQRPWPTADLPAGCIRAAAALTGIYESEVVLGISVNAEARISEQTATRQDCLVRPFTLHPRMLVAVGGDEPEGWVAQSEAFASHCVAAGLPTQMQLVSGANHFTVLECAVRDGHPLRDAVFDLWR